MAKTVKKPTIGTVRQELNTVSSKIEKMLAEQQRLRNELERVEEDSKFDKFRNLVGKYFLLTEYDGGTIDFEDYCHVTGFDDQEKRVFGVSVIFYQLGKSQIEYFELSSDDAENLPDYLEISKNIFRKKYIQVLNQVDNVLNKKRTVIIEKK